MAQSPRGRALREGAGGAAVSGLQAGLSKAGFVTGASGRFTAQTAGDVERFQRFYQLKPTGVADQHTLQVLHQVDKMDADATDSESSGGSGLVAKKARVKVRHSHAKRNVTTDPTKLIKSNPVLAPVKRDGGSAHLGNRTLHQHMHGHDVRVLQAYLTIDGYPTTVDGQYGPDTKANVVSWQSANNVAADGVFTYANSRTLRDDVAKVEASPKSVHHSPSAGTTAGPTATLNADGSANAPASAPEAVKRMIAAANSIDDKPYIYGGGHGSWNSPGYDCSGSTSFVLHKAGLLSQTEDSTQLESYGGAGRGHWVTIYADSGHAFIVIAGLAFDTAQYGPTTPAGSGPRWLTKANATANLSDGGDYVVRHPHGL